MTGGASIASVYSGYHMKSVNFNGSTRLENTGFTGMADGFLGMVSCWINFTGGDGSDQKIFDSNGPTIFKNTSNKIQLQMFSGGTLLFNVTSSTSITAASGIVHILASWNTNFTAGNKLINFYLNGVSDIGSKTDTRGALQCTYFVGDYYLGSTGVGTSFLSADLAGFYFNQSEYLDFSDVNNRQFFRDFAGNPVGVGYSGITPTGNLPICYQNVEPNQVANDFLVNRGSGNPPNWTVGAGSLSLGSMVL